MKKLIITILIKLGWGKNFSYAKWEKFGVEDICDGKIYWIKAITEVEGEGK